MATPVLGEAGVSRSSAFAMPALCKVVPMLGSGGAALVKPGAKGRAYAAGEVKGAARAVGQGTRATKESVAARVGGGAGAGMTTTGGSGAGAPRPCMVSPGRGDACVP